jgi:hypothetical protein
MATTTTTTTTLDSKVPDGPLEQKWDDHKGHLRLVNPNNKRRFTILVVGSGLAGASAAASFAELGYEVKCFCFQDSPRRAHSIAAQGGINATASSGCSTTRSRGAISGPARATSTAWRRCR